MFGSGGTAIRISNEEMNDIKKIVQSFKESGLLKNGISGFIGMLLGTLGPSLLGNLFTGEGTITSKEDV